MSFDDAGAPGQGESGDDRGEVAFEAGGEATELGQVLRVVGIDEFALRKGCAKHKHRRHRNQTASSTSGAARAASCR
ncbi:hypothetical protein [Streptodolium elevatio]